tara:strand:- start:392 stop:661 length:270 start_codon:yes stop_codon:yes gene_type:complete
MYYYVYLLITKSNKPITYVGYTNDIQKRLRLHNLGKGAKFTKGRKWKLIFSRKFKSKSKAMKEELKLKNDRIKRNNIKYAFLKKMRITN